MTNYNTKNIAMGADIGGSHITVSLVNIDDYSLVRSSYLRKKIDSGAPTEKIIKDWCGVIRDSFKTANLPIHQIGVAMPGPFDYKNGISYMKGNGKYEALYKLNVKELIAVELDIAPSDLKFNNDAACFLQGEVYNGNLKKHKNAIGITLGTGLGSAFMRENHAIDADLWKTPFKGGVIEDYISSRWFVGEFKKRAQIEITGVKEIIETYPTHPITKQLFEEFSSNLAKFLYPFLKKFNAELIVMGGNISNAHSFFLRNVQKHLYNQMGISVPIRISELGEDAALVGAASLFFENEVL